MKGIQGTKTGQDRWLKEEREKTETISGLGKGMTTKLDSNSGDGRPGTGVAERKKKGGKDKDHGREKY